MRSAPPRAAAARQAGHAQVGAADTLHAAFADVLAHWQVVLRTMHDISSTAAGEILIVERTDGAAAGGPGAA